MKTAIIRAAAAAFVSLLAGVSAHAQQANAQDVKWPTKSVRIIVPTAAGGPTDVLARLVEIVSGTPMNVFLKQRVFDPQPGGRDRPHQHLVRRQLPGTRGPGVVLEEAVAADAAERSQMQGRLRQRLLDDAAGGLAATAEGLYDTAPYIAANALEKGG